MRAFAKSARFQSEHAAIVEAILLPPRYCVCRQISDKAIAYCRATGSAKYGSAMRAEPHAEYLHALI